LTELLSKMKYSVSWTTAYADRDLGLIGFIAEILKLVYSIILASLLWFQTSIGSE